MVTISSACLPDARVAAYTGPEAVIPVDQSVDTVRGEVPVPLSEEELRALEQMERALVQEDPKLASTLRGTNLRRAAQRRAVLAGVCFVAGLAVLMGGAIGRITLVGVLGFVIMLASATVGLSAIRGPSTTHSPVTHGGHPQGSRLDRFGAPWRRRHDDQA
jgi:hypothetical protein